jgi:hypothetical protein
MAPVSHLDSARSRQGAPARRTMTGARRAALFASALQPSGAPDAAMAAEAITATVRRLGIHGCLSRMAQEFGDHPDAAAARVRWVCQLTAQMPAWPSAPASAGRSGSRASNDIQARNDHYGAAAGGAA